MNRLIFSFQTPFAMIFLLEKLLKQKEDLKLFQMNNLKINMLVASELNQKEKK